MSYREFAIWTCEHNCCTYVRQKRGAFPDKEILHVDEDRRNDVVRELAVDEVSLCMPLISKESDQCIDEREATYTEASQP